MKILKAHMIKPARPDAGFTLVEVLCVLVIIGLMTGAVVMTLPKPAPPEITHSDLMLSQLNRAMQATVISGQASGLGASKKAYALYAFESGEWQQKSEGSDWPDGVSASFTLEGQKLELTEDMAPLMVFEPTGQASIFTLTLSGDETQRVLVSDGSGRIVMQERLDED